MVSIDRKRFCNIFDTIYHSSLFKSNNHRTPYMPRPPSSHIISSQTLSDEMKRIVRLFAKWIQQFAYEFVVSNVILLLVGRDGGKDEKRARHKSSVISIECFGNNEIAVPYFAVNLNNYE